VKQTVIVVGASVDMRQRICLLLTTDHIGSD